MIRCAGFFAVGKASFDFASLRSGRVGATCGRPRAGTTRGRATQPTAKKTSRLLCELTGQDTGARRRLNHGEGDALRRRGDRRGPQRHDLRRLPGQIGAKDPRHREEHGGGWRARLPRGPELSRVLAQHPLGVPPRAHDAALVPGPRDGAHGHPLLQARPRRGAALSRPHLPGLVRRPGADHRHHRAVLTEGRRHVPRHLDPLAAGGEKHRVPGDVLPARPHERRSGRCWKGCPRAGSTCATSTPPRSSSSWSTSSIPGCGRSSASWR